MNPFVRLLNTYLFIKTRGLRAKLNNKVKAITRYSDSYKSFHDEELKDYFEQIKTSILEGINPEKIEVQLFALISEFARRQLGLNPYDVQILGALVLRRGKIIQMNTGEGKTLVAPFHAIIETIYGRRVIIVSPNDYLSERDYRWMLPLYECFGLKVTTVQPWFTNKMKHKAYGCDIVYVSTQQLVFDYLRKNHSLSRESHFPITNQTVIIDEIDNVLIDQGSRPYVLVKNVNFKSDLFRIIARYAKDFVRDQDFIATPKINDLAITDYGLEKIVDIGAELNLAVPESSFYIKCLLAAHYLYEKDKQYIIHQNRVVPIDDFTGRPGFGSSFSFGIQQAIEAKEFLPLSYPNTDINRISLHSFFTRFERISGMSGSAVHNSVEFKIVYKLDVVPIPPKRPCIREDYDDVIFMTKDEVINQVVSISLECMRSHRPVLIGTTNIDDAQSIAEVFDKHMIYYHLLTAKNHFEEAEIISNAGKAGQITIAAQMAGRGVDIKLDNEATNAGGLHMIGVSRQEDRRLDIQLQGRAGRQGDPGSSEFILSLEDDLMKVFGSERMMKIMDKFGSNEGESISHKMITKSISRAQRKLVLNRFFQRKIILLYDKVIEKAREFVFDRRERLLQTDIYNYEVITLIENLVKQISKLKASEIDEKLYELGKRFKCLIPPNILLLCQSDRQSFSKSLRSFLIKLYDKRREEAGEYAHARERLILLRSIDYCWTVYIDETKKMLEDIGFGGQQVSGVQIINEIKKRSLGALESLLNDIHHISLFYLMNIHDPKSLQEIKYWRGLGVVFGSGGEGENVDGIEVPEEYLSLYNRAEDDALELPAGKKTPLLQPHILSDKKKINECAQDYVMYCANNRKIKREKLDQIMIVLEEFTQFINNEDIELENAISFLPNFLMRLKSQRIGYIARRQQKRIILDFFKYMQKHRLIKSSIAVDYEDNMIRKIKSFFKTAANPVLVLQLSVVSFIFVLYRHIANVPLPFLHYSSNNNPFYKIEIPDYFIKLVDELLLCNALSNIGIGALGLLPVILTQFLINYFFKNQGSEQQIGTPILYFPLVFLSSIFISVFLIQASDYANSILWTQKILIWLSLMGGTLLLILLLWIFDFIEIMDYMQIVLLGNSLFIVFKEVATLLSINALAIQPLTSALIFFIIILYMVYKRFSIISFNIVRVGRFDFKAGEIKNTVTKVSFNTIFDGYHYMVSIVIVLIISYWISQFEFEPVWLKSNFIYKYIEYWQIPTFLFVIYWTIYKKALFRLSVQNIKAFMKKTESYIEHIQDWNKSISYIRNKVTIKMFVNLVHETLFVTLIMIFYYKVNRNNIEVEWLLYYTSLTALSIYLVFQIERQINAAYSQSPELTIFLLPLQIPDNETRWYTRLYFIIKEKYGFLGLLGIIATILTIIDYLIKFIRWIIL